MQPLYSLTYGSEFSISAKLTVSYSSYKRNRLCNLGDKEYKLKTQSTEISIDANVNTKLLAIGDHIDAAGKCI
jgi:hypothetical protein